MRKHIYFYLLLIVLAACKKEPKQYVSRLEKSLELSGENRTELEKVLTHYAKNDKDSLKYKAAIFLIENMEGHSYRIIRSRKEWNDILELSDSLIKIEHQDYEALIDSSYESHKTRYKRKKDLRQVKAKDLIENINVAFNVWPKPWNSYLDFNGFCNYILPYRQKEEPLELTLRKKYYQENKQKLNDTASVESMIKVAKEKSAFPYGYRYKRLIPFDQSISDIEKGKMTDCVDASIYSVFKSRSLGIPMAIDFTSWSNHNGSHYWPAMIHNKDSLLLLDEDFFEGTPGNYKTKFPVAKIYRHKFSSNSNRLVDDNLITFLNNPYIEDVTSHYIKTSKITIKLKNTDLLKMGSKAYLLIFNNKRWKEVDISEIRDSKGITFRNIGRNNFFLIGYYQDYNLIPISDIFYLDTNGNIEYFNPAKNKKKPVKITRKFNNKKLIRLVKRMFTSEFHLSNSPDFKTYKAVYRVSESDSVFAPRTIDIKVKGKYRYARYRSALNDCCDIAEMQWFNENGNIEGDIIASNSGYESDRIKAFDNDLLSSFSPNCGEGKDGYTWIGLDFKKRQTVKKLFFAPRSDVNYVKPNDQYELLYWDDQWISIGVQTATDYFIEYEDIPENTVCWLRNLSEGVEEELFVIKNGYQKFLMH